jgi:glycosyltransferase involved in cell wall biosynthesis
LRILHVISSMTAESGGPPRVVAHLARAQAIRGTRVSIASTGTDLPPVILQNLGLAWSRDDNVHFVLLPPLHRNGWIAHVLAPEHLESTIRKSDLVHVHGIWEPLLHMALRTAERFQKRTIITPHGMISHYGMQKKAFKKALCLRLYARSALERASIVHALTRTEADEILHYAPRANVRVIPNGISPAEFAAPPDRALISARIPELAAADYVLFLARLDHMKGIDVLIEAFALVHARLPELRLIVAGPDYGAGVQAVKRAEQLGIQDRVHFVGTVHGDEKRALLAHALCLAQPSRHEGFSISLLEALASGTPVVVSDRVDLPGLIEERAGRVVALQPSAVADAIVDRALGSEARENIGARAKKLVQERYTWEEVARQLAYECGPE